MVHEFKRPAVCKPHGLDHPPTSTSTGFSVPDFGKSLLATTTRANYTSMMYHRALSAAKGAGYDATLSKMFAREIHKEVGEKWNLLAPAKKRPAASK